MLEEQLMFQLKKEWSCSIVAGIESAL